MHDDENSDELALNLHYSLFARPPAQVDVVTPDGKLLARRLSLLIEAGHSVLVTGPNGSGKSSLFRILGGLWPLTAGAIQRPGAADRACSAHIFYVPQKPYTTIGTLREQAGFAFSGLGWRRFGFLLWGNGRASMPRRPIAYQLLLVKQQGSDTAPASV
jgi:ABC-type cobalamin/Fe3+-siderophores transport system ATPase subunit